MRMGNGTRRLPQAGTARTHVVTTAGDGMTAVWRIASGNTEALGGNAKQVTDTE